MHNKIFYTLLSKIAIFNADFHSQSPRSHWNLRLSEYATVHIINFISYFLCCSNIILNRYYSRHSVLARIGGARLVDDQGVNHRLSVGN